MRMTSVRERHPLGGTVEFMVRSNGSAGPDLSGVSLVAAASPVETAPAQLVAASAGSDPDMEWRRLSGNSNRLLPIAAWARQVEVCYWLWKTNPLGNWLIELMTALITGNGYTVTSKNENLLAFIKKFWGDPINDLDVKIENKVRELSIFGVQCWPIFKGEQTGRIRMGMIDPAQIRNIYSDPENAELLIGVQISNFHTGEPRYLKTIIGKEAETVLSASGQQMRDGYLDGECFLEAINRVSNDPFGTSDIFIIADWLDEYEELLYDYSGKVRKQNAFVWDVKLDGANEEACEAYAQKFPSQSDGSVRVHNEKVTWDAIAPKLSALEMEKAVKELRNHILGCKNIPEHWYGGGGQVNRATAGESNDPIQAFVGKRQQTVKQILCRMIDYAIQSALDVGYPLDVPKDELGAYEIQVPEATNKDVSKVGAAVQQLVAAMTMAASQGWLDQETGVRLFAFIVQMIGFAIDEEAVLEADPAYKDYPAKGPSGPGKVLPLKQPQKTGEGA